MPPLAPIEYGPLTPSQREALAALAPLKAEARAKGMVFQLKSWLHAEVRMTADRLDAENERGRYLWSPENWKLEYPKPNDTAWGYTRIIPH